MEPLAARAKTKPTPNAASQSTSPVVYPPKYSSAAGTPSESAAPMPKYGSAPCSAPRSDNSTSAAAISASRKSITGSLFNGVGCQPLKERATIISTSKKSAKPNTAIARGREGSARPTMRVTSGTRACIDRLEEVRKDTKPRSLALLRMELCSDDTAASNHRGEGLAVGTRGNGVGNDRCRVGVKEVDVVACGDAVDARMACAHLERVPAHVRNARCSTKARHDTGKDAEPRVLAVFVAAFEEELHADANAQKRPAAGEHAADGIVERALAQRIHRRAEGAVTGKNHGIGEVERRRLIRQRETHPKALQRAGQRAEVAAPVVDHRDHRAWPYSKMPLVEGTSTVSVRRLAARKARANALNEASQRWWATLPFWRIKWRLNLPLSVRARKNSPTSSVLRSPRFSTLNLTSKLR